VSATLREAMLDRLRSALTPVYDGEGEAPSTPTAVRYAVLHIDPGTLSADDVANTPRLIRHYPTVTAVGTTPQQVDWVARRVRDALTGWAPTVDGWAYGPVEHDSTGRAQRDDDVSPPLYDCPLNFNVRGSR